jgi:hypothetical protein
MKKERHHQRINDGVPRSHRECVDEVGEGVSRSRFECDWWGDVFKAIAGAFIGVMHMFGPDWRCPECGRSGVGT